MKTVVFCAFLVCFVATVQGTGNNCELAERSARFFKKMLSSGIGMPDVGNEADFKDRVKNVAFTGKTKNHAWMGPGCCDSNNLLGLTKEMCARVCIAQKGNGDKPFEKPCSRITYYKATINGQEENICRIHNGCLNATNKIGATGSKAMKHNYLGLEAATDETVLPDHFWAVHRNCLTEENMTAAKCAKLLETKHKGVTDRVPGEAPDTCKPQTEL